MHADHDLKTVRPSDLMCLVCQLGAGVLDRPENKRFQDLFEFIRKNPRQELQIVGYDGSCFTPELPPERMEFNMLRDAEILGKIGMNSGATAPALALLEKVVNNIAGTGLLCGRAESKSPAWKACPEAAGGHFARGKEIFAESRFEILPALYRRPATRAQAKTEWDRKIMGLDTVQIYPAHLRCITCWYGRGTIDTLGEPATNPQDELNEIALAMRQNPEVRIKFTDRHCMVCPSCGAYDTEAGNCGLQKDDPKVLRVRSGDLNFLRAMGVQYKDILPAADVMRRCFEAFPNPGIVCGPNCHNLAATRAGAEAGLGFLDAWENPAGVIKQVRALLKLVTVLPVEEREFMTGILDQADKALHAGKRREAYQVLVDRHFWNCWKYYLEKGALVMARLPKTVKTEIPTPVRQPTDTPPGEGITGAGPLPGGVRPDSYKVGTGGGLQPSQADPRLLTARSARGRIVCDGRLDEPAWQRRPFSTGFRAIVNRPALADAGVKALYDREALMLGLICPEKDIKALKAEALFGNEIICGTQSRTGDPAKAFQWKMAWFDADASLCAMIKPDENSAVYYMFTVNSKAVKLGQRMGPKGDAIIHESEWQAGAYVDKKWWTVELRIPFRLLSVTGPGRKPWRIQFHHLFGREKALIESWSFCGRKWKDVTQFGKLVFG